MTVTLASRAIPRSVPRLTDPRAKSILADGRRDQFQLDAKRHDQDARAAAERGDIEAAARSILALLDCERRLASSGPQVMQVIKPRA